MVQRIKKGRNGLIRNNNMKAHKPYCKQGHEYTEKNTYFTSKGSINCRTCDRIRKADRRGAKKETEVAGFPTFGKEVYLSNPWEATPEVPVVETEPEEELKVPKKLLNKELPFENQRVIPFWPSNGMFVDGDNHFPVADPVVTNAKLKFVQDMKPSLWVNVGDLLDFWLASRFNKEANRLFGEYGSRLQDEIDSARTYVDEICDIVKQAHFIPGNHEHRHERLIDVNPALHGLRALGWKNIFQYPANFYTHAYGTRLKVNEAPLFLVHGDQIVPDRVSAPAQYMLQKRVNQTTIFGHTHKASEAYRTGYDENREPIIYGAINSGHGCLVQEQTYAGPEPDWQHAFCYVEFFHHNNKPRFSIHLIKVIDGCFKFRGKLYDGNVL